MNRGRREEHDTRTRMESAGWAAQPRFVCLLLAAITVAVFWSAASHDFVNYDDPGYITANPHVQQGLNWAGLKWAFSSPVSSNWHPLTVLSHILACQVFGLNPWGHHLTNVLLHALNAMLVFALLQQMTGARWRSLFVAALFALHPLRVESVAWVAERKDVLSGFFGLLALIFYVRYAQQSKVQSPKSKVSYVSALVCFFCGLLSKPTLVTWPFVMLLLDYWPLGRSAECGMRSADAGPGNTVQGRALPWMTLVREKVPLFALAAAASVVTLVVQTRTGSVLATQGLPLGARGGNALISYCRHLGNLFWPTNLAVFYPHPEHWPLLKLVLAGGLILGISTVLFVQRRRAPFLLMGWLWFLGMLVPMIGLVQTGAQAMADRHTYLPSLGVLVLAVWGAHELAGRWHYGVMALSVVGAAAIVLCAVLTRQQLGYWKDSETLFRHALGVTKDNWLAHNNLGGVLAGQGMVDQAISYFVEALRFKRDFAEAHNNLGLAFTAQNRLEEAQEHLTRALQIDPKWPGAYCNLGQLRLRQGNREAAIAAYRQALALDAALPEPQNILGCLLSAQGNLAEATTHFQEAVRCRPDFTDALNNLGTLLTEQGRAAEALAPLTKAIQLKPDYADAHYNLANAYVALKRIREALVECQTVLRLEPRHALAHYKLANLLLAEGNAAAAVEHYRASLAANTNLAEAHFQLATLLVPRNAVEDGVSHYREALRLKPDWVEPLNNLAWLLATYPEPKFRNGADAVRLAARAAELTKSQDAQALDTLGAAYAEAGQFKKAVAAVERSLDLANAAQDKELVKALQVRLELYRAERPYRE
jgi:protein O-mannosyl-transferase